MMKLVSALEELWGEHGRPEVDGEDDVLGVLVRMMLAQATSRANAAKAFGDLLDRFAGDWAAIATAPVADVASAIAVGGLSNQKAPRLQRLLLTVQQDFGTCSLEQLRAWGPDRALAYLQKLDGVGPTTARFTLMAAAGMDVFPVNGGIRRVLTRLGVLDGSESDRVAHELAEAAIPRGSAYAAHMALVRHARQTCRTTPRCDQCCISICPASRRG